jgi:hypothetical protein
VVSTKRFGELLLAVVRSRLIGTVEATPALTSSAGELTTYWRWRSKRVLAISHESFSTGMRPGPCAGRSIEYHSSRAAITPGQWRFVFKCQIVGRASTDHAFQMDCQPPPLSRERPLPLAECRLASLSYRERRGVCHT